jgi:hypothetical protein
MLIDVAVDVRRSTCYEIPPWASEVMVKCPLLDSCTLTLEMLGPDDVTAAKLQPDIDTDWIRVISGEGNTDFLGIGVGPAFVNVTPFVQGFPRGAFLRIRSSVPQTANRTFLIYFKGP